MSEELRKSLVIGGTRYALAVGQAGEGPPGEDTPGKVGVTYLDTAADPPALYACTAAARDGERIVCSWVRVGGAGEGSGQNPAGTKVYVTLDDDGTIVIAPDVGDHLADGVTITATLTEDGTILIGGGSDA